MLQLKSYLLFISCLFTLSLIFADHRALAQIHNGFLITGSVTDLKQQPVPGASVTILNATNEQVISKTITNTKGEFAVEGKEEGIEILVSYVGYGIYKSKPITVSKNMVLDPIVLNEDNKLKEVEIKGQNTPPLIQASGGKIIFNVSNSISSQGSNVLEVLKKHPV